MTMTDPPQAPLELEYSIEATSEEEGIFVELPLPRTKSNDDADEREMRGDSPFDEARADHHPSFSPDLLAAESETKSTATARSAKSVKSKSSAKSNASRGSRSQKIPAIIASLAGSHAAAGTSDAAQSAMAATKMATNDNDSPLSNNDEEDKEETYNLRHSSTSTSSAAPPGPPQYYLEKPPSRKSFLGSLNFRQQLREYRHSQCIMTPLSTLVILAILLSSLVTMLCTIPQFLIGLLLGPLVKRNFWLVEFLYRFDIARWGHLKIMEMAGKKKKSDGKSSNKSNNNSQGVGGSQKMQEGHSATLQQRITVVEGRVYVHLIPQFMDNLAYLIVCTPPPPSETNSDSADSSTSSPPILGVLIDCGESDVILQYMEQIYFRYYANDHPIRNGKMGIELHAILCTHRHHDHTAGVKQLREELIGMHLSDANSRKTTVGIYHMVPGNLLVVGGAVESVPHCNLFVKNGCFVPLPCVSVKDDEGYVQTNDMSDVVSIEVIGVPSHTRGSVVYALRNRRAPQLESAVGSSVLDRYNNNATSLAEQQQQPPLQSHLFTGDAIFTGGGGVPFEADLEHTKDNFVKNPANLKSKNGNSEFRPGAGALSMERSFVEVLTRARGPWSQSQSSMASSLTSDLPQAPSTFSTTSLIPQTPSSETQTTTTSTTLLYPGHEYTTDLLLRQFTPNTLSTDISWTKLAPSTFFSIASHYLVSAHRRALPPGQKLSTLPTTLEREVVVNPNYRMLKRRGEILVNCLRLWYDFGAKNLIIDNRGGDGHAENDARVDGAAGVSKEDDSVFTTVYSQDLNQIIAELRSGNINPASAADQLQSLSAKLDERPIARRPIPSTLPSHKNVYLGIVALTILGSAPSAVTVSDAGIMNMAKPMERVDGILISKTRLIAALDGLGLLSEYTSPTLQDIIHHLWKEASLDDDLKLDIEHPNSADNIGHANGTDGVKHPNDTDIECSIDGTNRNDEIELGLLKLALFGVAFSRPSKFCLPCGTNPKPKYDERSWVTTTKLRRTAGELVRHDAENCPLCRGVMLPGGCPAGCYGNTGTGIS